MYILTEKVPIEWKSSHWKIIKRHNCLISKHKQTKKKIKSHIYNDNSNILVTEFLKNNTNILIKELNFCH